MTVYSPATSDQAYSDINLNAVDGDTVNVPAATWDFGTSDLTPPSDFTLSGSDISLSNLNGNLVLSSPGGSFTVNNLSADGTGRGNVLFWSIAGPTEIRFDSVEVSGNDTVSAAAGNVGIDDGGAAYSAVLCRFSTKRCSSGDGIDFGATGGAVGSDCRAVAVWFVGSDCGDGTGDQAITSHYGVPLYILDAIVDQAAANGRCVANDDATPLTVIRGTFWTRRNGLSPVGIPDDANCTLMHATLKNTGSYPRGLDTQGLNSGNTLKAIGCHIYAVGTGGLDRGINLDDVDGDATIGRCIIESRSGDQYVGLYFGSAGGDGQVTIANCLFDGADRQWRLDQDAASKIKLVNSIFKDTDDTDIWDVTGDTNPTWTGSGYNIFALAADQQQAGYSGTGDLVSTAAEIDGNFVPIRYGNCDLGRGDPTVWSLGDLDRWERPKLRVDADSIGPVYPQRNVPENVMHPVWQFASEGEI